jgi:hypothetical protein
MRTDGIIGWYVLMIGLALVIGYTPVRAEERVVPTSAIVPPTHTGTVVSATNTVVAPTSTTTPSGNVSGTQTAVVVATQTAAVAATQTAAVNRSATATLTPGASATAVVVTSTVKPTQTQPGKLPETGITDGIEVWQNQPLIVVMIVTGVLGLAFLFYGQRH